jgi:ssDNA-binding Zn-finger/Zn-ribbon topoisomerase 1
MTDTKANKTVEMCPTCRKPLAKVGPNGKFRCCYPACPVVFVERDDNKKSKLPSRSRWRG